MSRLLALTQSLRFGGDDTILIELIRAWSQEDRWTVMLNGSHPGLPVYRQALQGRADIVSLKTPADGEPGSWGVWTASWRLKPLIQAARPDAVLVGSGGFPPTSLTLGFLLAARLAGAPRLVLSVHNEPNLGEGLRALWRSLRGRLAARLCHAVVSVSSDCAAKVAVSCGRPVEIIYNGTEQRPDRETPASLRRELGLPETALLIGAIGHLEQRKGFRVLLEAFRLLAPKLPPARLVLIGGCAEPAEEKTLKELAEDPVLKGKVTLAGYLPQAWRFCAAFDVCAIPSLRRESFGLLALDAMQAGKPVVAARTGGLPEIIADGETGLIVPPADPTALAVALERILRDATLARRLGDAGRAKALERFSASRMAKEYERLLLKPGKC